MQISPLDTKKYLNLSKLSFKGHVHESGIGYVADNESEVPKDSIYAIPQKEGNILCYNALDALSKGLLFEKNANQILSIPPEHNGAGLKSLKAGGLGNVAYEAMLSWLKDLGADVRSIIPYHLDSAQGKLKIARLPKEERKKLLENNEYPKLLKEEWIHEVDKDYVTTENEFFVNLNDSPEEKKDPKEDTKYGYIPLVDTGIRGEITSLKEAYMEQEQIPYRIFKKATADGGETKYFAYTPQTAAMKKCYGNNGAYKPGQIIGEWYDLYYANCMRAIRHAMPQMAIKEKFNPASIVLHDRPMIPFQFECARLSAEGDDFMDGSRIHSIFHNPGYDYQGYFDLIQSFLRIAYDNGDFEKFKNREDFYEIKEILSKPAEDHTPEEKEILLSIFEPYFKNMLDDNEKTNTTMIAVANAIMNPDYATYGTVSRNYGDEMVLLSDTAEGITQKLVLTRGQAINITNGSLPASLKLDEVTNIGMAGNGISDKHKSEFTTYSPVLDNNGKVMNYTAEDRAKSIEKYTAEKEKVQAEYKVAQKALKEKNEELEKQKKGVYPKRIKSLNTLKESIKKEIENINKKNKADIENELNNYKKKNKKATKKQLDTQRALITKNINDKSKDSLDTKNARIAKIDNTIKKWELRNTPAAKEKAIAEQRAAAAEEARLKTEKKKYDILFNMTSVEEAKEANKKWILDLISSCNDKNGNVDQLKINNLFFNSEQIKKDFKVYGSLSKYSEDKVGKKIIKDKVFVNWGRPDPQKGYPTFLQGYYKFLTMPAPAGASKEEIAKLENYKKHAKLLFGSGNGTWDKDSKEKELIEYWIGQIQKLEGGKYKNNVCYVDGLFPNKLIGAADFGFFTSRFEPCGITPLETAAAGNPTLSIKTGGAPDLVKNLNDKNVKKEDATGILTKHPFMLEKNVMSQLTNGKFDLDKLIDEVKDGADELTSDMKKYIKEEVDEVRRNILSDEIADLFYQAMDMSDEQYRTLSKNACEQKIEWDNNADFNGGRSANQCYFEDVFGIEYKKLKPGETRKFIRPRVKAPMNKLTEQFGTDTIDYLGVPHAQTIAERRKELARKNVSFAGLSVYQMNCAKKQDLISTKSFVG